MTLSVPSGASGAKAALDGYEYQLDVSILAALKLLLITKSATRITLEPADEEDLEADLEPATPGRVTPSANMAEGYRLVVQVKLRNTGPWSISDFERLLKHGKKRKPAKDHLDDLDTRYLLVTSADAAGVARDLLVQGLEEWPDKKTFPASLSGTLPHAPEGRVAIWGVLTEKLLTFEIDDVLGALLRVPQPRQAECRSRLREEARRRMRGTGPGVWTREDLLATIRACGGYLASAPELEAFVPPSNFDAMGELFDRRNAVIITGPSGTGKTWAALALCDRARRQQAGLEIVNVNVNNDPSSMRTLIDSGPTLYYVEDPWGQYSLRGGAEVWTEQLPRLLREARPHHRYVITSRTDMLGQARAQEGLKSWSVVLDADQYRDGELVNIYNKRLDLLASELQAKALAFRKDALDALETPLELDLFFSHLADGAAADENDHAFYRRIVEMAHRDAVEGVVVRYLSASDPSGASAIVWALLAARSQFGRSQLIAIQREMRRVDADLADGLERLVNRLVATRHLRQPTQTLSFAHPSVRAGFEAFLRENWGRSVAAFTALIPALTQLAGDHRSWGLETAARALAAITGLTQGDEALEGIFEADAASRAAIDAWLEEGLLDPGADFQPLLKLASDVGTAMSTPSELSRWFVRGVRRGGQWFLERWSPPSFDDAWYARVSADPRSAIIADRFVREELPREQDRFGADFVDKLDRIAPGLTPAFLAAAMAMIGAGYERNVDATAAGAVRDIDAYARVLNAALDELAEINKTYQLEGRETWRAIEDGERDAGDEEGYRFSHEDDGYAAGMFVDVYVRAIRALGDWRVLAEHPRVSELARAWADEISRSAGPATIEELRAVIAATRNSGDEDHAWEAVRQHWQPALSADLETRILSDPSDQALRDAVAHCALVKSPGMLGRCCSLLAERPTQLAHLLVDAHGAQHRIHGKNRARRVRPFLTSLSSTAREVFEALATKNRPARAVGPAALSLLGQAAVTTTPFVLDQIAPVIIASGGDATEAIRRWLTTTDKQLASAAADAAIQIKDDSLVWLALDHPRADARKAALEYLASPLPAPLPAKLLTCASDPSARVRRALVRILAARPHPDHQAVLVGLVEDRWSDAEPQYNEDPSYPIAREAITALDAYGVMADEIGERLLALAERTDDRTLGMVALNVAAKRCSSTIRQKIWALSFIDQPRWVRVDAIDALTWADVVEEEILDQVTPALLLRLAPPLAASASILLGAHGRVEAVGANDGAHREFQQASGALAAGSLGFSRARSGRRRRPFKSARGRAPGAPVA